VSVGTSGEIPVAFAAGTSVIGLAAAAIFLVSPDIDLTVARAFTSEDGSFLGVKNTPLIYLREFFKFAYIASCAVFAIGLGLAIARPSRHLRMSPAIWAFLVLSISVGPGIVANVLLKDEWGRARPYQVLEFGGTKQFTPALVPTDQCKRNCSFVSGEASAVFAPLFALALVVPQWSGALIIAGTVAGSVAGVIRMAQGAHFLSDIVFAGVFMALTVTALHWAILGRARLRAPIFAPTAATQRRR
jgi:lipid A 4'-phosphatase